MHNPFPFLSIFILFALSISVILFLNLFSQCRFTSVVLHICCSLALITFISCIFGSSKSLIFFLPKVSANSASQPIPILPPPPAPLSTGPSRARRQLAARLAAQKQQAADTAEGEDGEQPEAHDSQWSTNPFIIAGIDDDTEGGGSAFPNVDFSGTGDQTFSPFPESGFSPPDSLSSHSSDGEGDGQGESLRRRVRVPLEVEEDDEMGEMVAPSAAGIIDSDEEEDAIINESLGYSNLTGPNRYSNLRRSRDLGKSFDDEQNDSSDGEDDGLVEILVPGRKSSSSN